MFTAYKNYWSRTFDYGGHSNQSDFWWVFLCNSLIYLGLSGIFRIFIVFTGITFFFRLGSELGNDSVNENHLFSPMLSLMTGLTIYRILMLCFILILALPSISLIVRRLRDAGFHWALIFLLLIPFVGWIPVLVLCTMPTKLVQAYYGQNPYPNYPANYYDPSQAGSYQSQANPAQASVPYQTNPQANQGQVHPYHNQQPFMPNNQAAQSMPPHTQATWSQLTYPNQGQVAQAPQAGSQPLPNQAAQPIYQENAYPPQTSAAQQPNQTQAPLDSNAKQPANQNQE